MKFKSKELNFIVSKIRNPKDFYLGVIVAFLVAAIAAFLPYISGRLVDLALQAGISLKVLGGFLFVWLVLALLHDVLDWFVGKKSYRVAIDLFCDLQVELVSHLLKLPMSFHKEKKAGEVFKKIDRATDEVFMFVENTLFSFFPSIISFIIAVIILTLVDWRLSGVLLIACACYIWVTFRFAKKNTKLQKMMHQALDDAYGEMYDSLTNVHTIKVTANEDWEERKFVKSHDRIGGVGRSWWDVWQAMSFWQKIIMTISFIIVFGIGVLLLRAGILSAGKLVMFIGYVGLLTSPLSQISDQYRRFKTGIAAFKRAYKIYEILPEQDYNLAIEPKDLKGQVVFDNVSFGYKKNEAIIKDVSFKAETGEKIALVGESGVGKTTLVDLIGRYYFPNKGKILIDGVNIKNIKLSSLRNNIALVPQEVVLFNDTIKNNIKYGKPKATDEEVMRAIKIANAYEFIDKFPKKLDQIVGERGIKLSTGQKQRVAIARAVIRDPRILILDEATSALDSVSEKLIQEALEKLIQGRTTFIIAHRLSTIKNADKIIVLENGRIAEMGNHQELMESPDGIYRNFWELQSAIQKVES
ncbi:MAG: ABC transporter ATP-binding protein [Candidatus Pacebacteria bacterium]|nr:ABC transporter ATP-binding protein [Candidatus Paceibacterota bacterium]